MGTCGIQKHKDFRRKYCGNFNDENVSVFFFVEEKVKKVCFLDNLHKFPFVTKISLNSRMLE